MPEWDFEKLLGGYATGTLTEEERNALFGAALHDQELFNILANEQALKEILDDPVSRRRLLDALSTSVAEPAGSWFTSFLAGFRRRPTLALAGSLATAAIAIVVVMNLETVTTLPQHQDRLVAQSDRLERPDALMSPDTQDAEVSKDDAVTFGDAMRETLRSQKTVGEAQRAERFNKPTAPGAAPSADTPAPAKQGALKKEKEARLPATAPAVASEEAAPAGQSRTNLGLTEHPATALSEMERPTSPSSQAGRPVGEPAQALQAFTLPGVTAGPARALFYGEPAQAPPRQAQSKSVQPRRRAVPESRALLKESDEAVRDDVAGLSRKDQKSAPAARSVVRPLGIRYSLLKQEADGIFRETSPDGPFGMTDKLRLSVEVNEPGYLYVFHRVSSGHVEQMFPQNARGRGQRAEPGSGSRVMRETPYVIPESGTLPLGVPPQSARIILIYSRTAEPDLQPDPPTAPDVKDASGKVSSGIERYLGRHAMEASTKPLVKETVTPSPRTDLREKAVYVVNPEVRPDATITIAIVFPRG